MVRWESSPSRRRKPGDPGYHGGRWDPNAKEPKKSGCPLAALAIVTVAWLVRRQLR
jgi:hypothetical protein